MVKKERMIELVRKAVEFAYDERNPPDTLVTPEAIDATPEEFLALMDFLDRILDPNNLFLEDN